MTSLVAVVLIVALSLPVACFAELPLGPRANPSTDYKPFDSSYQLVWSDEFDQPDGSRPNPATWNYEIGGSGWGNRELEYYTERVNNSYIQHGHLVIQGLREQYKDHNYTSARLDSNGKVSVLYGLIAARARIRMYDGYWPAFWLVGTAADRVDWPRCGEMDIMEQVNGRGTGARQDDSLQFGTLHYNQYGENSSSVNHEATGGIIRQKQGHYWGDEFHLYQALWTNTSYTFMVDDLAYEQVDLTTDIGYDSFQDPSNPFFFIVNLALGGDFPDIVPEEGFPAHFELDWIRVWQQAGGGGVLSKAEPRWAEAEDIVEDDERLQARKWRDMSGMRDRLQNRHTRTS